jgi:Beta-lactamase enzyme family
MRRRYLAPFALFLAVFFLVGASSHAILRARPASAEGLEDLQVRLQEAIEASGFDVTMAVTDLQTGETAAVRGEEPRLSGCTINVLVLIQATLDMQAGLLQKEDVDFALRQTILWSDPHYSRQIVSKIGGGDILAGVVRVQELASSLGLQTALFDHPPAYDMYSTSLPAPPPPDPQETAILAAEAPMEGEILPPLPPDLVVPANVISPSDMNRLLGALWRNEILSPEWTSYLLERMTRVSSGLQFILGTFGGSGTVVSHKNGYTWSPESRHTDGDVGLVRFTVGDTEYAYAVSYYASQLDDELGDIGIAQRLMRITRDYFNQKY